MTIKRFRRIGSVKCEFLEESREAALAIGTAAALATFLFATYEEHNQ
jgi:hypothetical protein